MSKGDRRRARAADHRAGGAVDAVARHLCAQARGAVGRRQHLGLSRARRQTEAAERNSHRRPRRRPRVRLGRASGTDRRCERAPVRRAGRRSPRAGQHTSDDHQPGRHGVAGGRLRRPARAVSGSRPRCRVRLPRCRSARRTACATARARLRVRDADRVYADSAARARREGRGPSLGAGRRAAEGRPDGHFARSTGRRFVWCRTRHQSATDDPAAALESTVAQALIVSKGVVLVLPPPQPGRFDTGFEELDARITARYASDGRVRVVDLSRDPRLQERARCDSTISATAPAATPLRRSRSRPPSWIC